MDKSKFFSIVLLCFSLVMLVNAPAFAERECTHQVTTSNGTKDILIDCSSSYMKTNGEIPEDVFNKFMYETMKDNLQFSVQQGLENTQDRIANTSSKQGGLDQIAADSQEKQQEAIDAEQIKQQDVEDRLEEAKH